jgi:hypothetical protein
MLVTQAISQQLGAALTLCWSQGASRSDALELVDHIQSIARVRRGTFAAGESIRYGYWAVTIMPDDDGSFSLYEYNDSGTRLVRGCARALRYSRSQRDICQKYASLYAPPLADELVAVDPDCLAGGPVEGGRYELPPGHSGWVLLSEVADQSRLVTEHLYHVTAARSDLVGFLALEHGYRFYSDGTTHEVIYDETISS